MSAAPNFPGLVTTVPLSPAPHPGWEPEVGSRPWNVSARPPATICYLPRQPRMARIVTSRLRSPRTLAGAHGLCPQPGIPPLASPESGALGCVHAGPQNAPTHGNRPPGPLPQARGRRRESGPIPIPPRPSTWSALLLAPLKSVRPQPGLVAACCRRSRARGRRPLQDIAYRAVWQAGPHRRVHASPAIFFFPLGRRPTTYATPPSPCGDLRVPVHRGPPPRRAQASPSCSRSSPLHSTARPTTSQAASPTEARGSDSAPAMRTIPPP